MANPENHWLLHAFFNHGHYHGFRVAQDILNASVQVGPEGQMKNTDSLFWLEARLAALNLLYPQSSRNIDQARISL